MTMLFHQICIKLEYVGMNESEFWEIADTFRDPKVWWTDGMWYKENIWNVEVHMEK